jgi:predicted amidohydrolase
VVAAAQVGNHSAKRQSYGHALCVDPWGKVVAEAGALALLSPTPAAARNSLASLRLSATNVLQLPQHHRCSGVSSRAFAHVATPPGGSLPEIIYADIDLGTVERVRATMPVIDHERPAAYCFDPEQRAAS